MNSFEDASGTSDPKGTNMGNFQAAGTTDQGRVRSRNEDAYYVGTWVFAVADGLGGHPAGDVASATALEPLGELDRDGDTDEVSDALTTAVETAHERVRAAAAGDPANAGMGTTLTAVALTGGTLTLAHVGDSRCYLLRGGELMQLSVDHTPVQLAVDAGQLDHDTARDHPERHVLAQAVGLDDGIQVDTRGGTELQPGDRVLLCSDGLTEMLPDARIAELLGADGDVETLVCSLTAAAVEAGGVDNVTTVVLRIDE